jgi:hypothetical protein
LADIRGRQESAAAAIAATHAAQLAEAQGVRDSKREQAQERASRRLKELEELDQSERGIIERHWKGGVTEARSVLLAITDELKRLCPDWDSPTWDRFEARSDVPPAVSFGSFAVDLAALPGGLSQHPQMQIEGPTSFAVPSILDLFERGSLFIQAGRDGAASASQLLCDVMLRLLTTFPPSKVRFTIIDPSVLVRTSRRLCTWPITMSN